MSKILIFGNSGSGKSTLAKYLCETQNLAHLDLDTLAWKATMPPERKPLEESLIQLQNFVEANKSWVIEGCYTDLLELLQLYSDEIIYMNLSVEECINNARNRPWEPHKYPSKKAQDENLEMLLNWIQMYTERNDTFSKIEHQKFYDNYPGKKTMYTQNQKIV